MIIDARLKLVLRVLTGLVLLVVYVPLALVVVNSFSVDRTFTWPPSGASFGGVYNPFDTSPGNEPFVDTPEAYMAFSRQCPN